MKGSAGLLRSRDSIAFVSLETGNIVEMFDKKIMQSQSNQVSEDYSNSGGCKAISISIDIEFFITLAHNLIEQELYFIRVILLQLEMMEATRG